MKLRTALALIAGAACPPTGWNALTAQEPPPAPAGPAGAQDEDAALQARIDKAMADYEAIRKDKDKLAMRARLLGWLGEIDDPGVTDYLRGELKAFARGRFGISVIEAIAKQPRPELQRDVLAVLKNGKSNRAARVAAAGWIIARGGDGAERMLAIATDKKANPNLRTVVVQALARSDSAPAHRGLAELILDGDNDHRLQMLRLCASVRDVAVISNARVRCVKEGNLIVAATAWRQLATEGHVRAKVLTIDVLERVFDKPDAASAAELVRGLVLVRDPDFYPAILRFGAVAGSVVKTALRDSAAAAARDPALLRWLVEDGLDADTPAKRKAAKLLLLEAPAETLQPLVARIRKQLRFNRKKVLETAAGLHELLARDPTWPQDLAKVAAARDLESRMIGLSMLLEMGSPAAIESAQKYLRNRTWELRSLAMRYLTKCRDVSSIPDLIARYGKEEGRLAHELDKALFVHTGTRCWSRSDWVNWWRRNKDGFELPHPRSVATGGGSGGGTTVSYYDIPLVSTRIAFLVDRSGSMRAKVGTDRKRTRLDLAKEQLTQVVGSLSKEHQCNLILFETSVFSVWDELRRLDKSNREELLEAVKKIPYGGGTNTFGALVEAFEDPDVDTIYLMTDGLPTQGDIVDPLDIVDEIMHINRTRQIVIHCISVGLDSPLLKDLAALTGGEYKYVR